MRLRVLGALMAGAFLLPAAPAHAAHPQERRGFWIGFGAGYGSADISSDGAGGNRENGLTGFFRLGGTLNDWVLLGVESNLWTKKAQEEGIKARITLGNLAAATLTVYPRPSSGFFIKMGGGLSYVRTTFSEGTVSVTIDKTGFGFVAGLGYDVRVAPNVSLTPCFNFYYGKPGRLEFEGETILENWKQNVFDFGLGITFH